MLNKSHFNHVSTCTYVKQSMQSSPCNWHNIEECLPQQIAERKNSKCLKRNRFGESQIIVGRGRNSRSRAGTATLSRNGSLHFNIPNYKQCKTQETKIATQNPIVGAISTPTANYITSIGPTCFQSGLQLHEQ